MLPDPKVQEALKDYVCVEWRYDGLGGKVIQWTKAHGIDHDDPSDLGWILAADETVLAGPQDGFHQSPSALVQRLKQLADSGMGPRIVWEDATPGVAQEARIGGKPVLLYFRKEKGKDPKSFGDPKTVKLSGSFTCLALDWEAEGTKGYADSLGIPSAPAAALLPSEEGKPVVLKGPVPAEKLRAEMQKLLK